MFPYVHKFKQLSHGNGDPSVIGPVRNFSELQLKKYCCEQTIAAVFILFYFLSLTESHSHEYIQRCKYSDARNLEQTTFFETVWNFHRNQCFVALGRSYFEWWLSVGRLLSKKSAVFDLATLLGLQRDFSLCPAQAQGLKTNCHSCSYLV